MVQPQDGRRLVQGQVTLAHPPSLSAHLGLGDIINIMYNEDIMNIRRETPMAGVAGKSGRHKRADDRASENLEGLFLRLRSEILTKVWSCKGKIEHQEGVSLSKAEAVERILEAGCEALEGTREGRETPAPFQFPISGISEISSTQISKISEISGDDVSVPGYGFPEDEEEIPAPASHTNGQGAPAPQPTTQPAIPLALEPAPKTAPPVAVPQTAETPEPAVQTAPRAKRPASHALPPETLQAIADERTHCEGLSYREFAQRLHDREIYSSKAKDGSHVPANPGNVKKWLEQAREAGVL